MDPLHVQLYLPVQSVEPLQWNLEYVVITRTVTKFLSLMKAVDCAFGHILRYRGWEPITLPPPPVLPEHKMEQKIDALDKNVQWIEQTTEQRLSMMMGSLLLKPQVPPPVRVLSVSPPSPHDED